MGHHSKKKSVLLALACIGLVSTLQAGKIGVLTDQASPPSYSSGYGGWSLEGVNVKITDLEFAPLLLPKVFDPLTGYYDTMVVGETFESELYEANSTNVLAYLHGKDWPVGEPPGLKVMESSLGYDAVTSNSKPASCIMTTSYLEASYLDAASPLETLCDSDFQTHKRFKVNMLPSMVASVGEGGGYAKGFDLTFKTVHDANTWRYMVLQKINNYTNKRLDGYKMEIGFVDENGTFNTASSAGADIRFSLGAGEDEGADIWSADDLATFSHGLFGKMDSHFLEDGFFDDTSAGYYVALSVNEDTITSTAAMPSNYTSLFGSWLPSLWAPKGIFWDDDNDVNTDPKLMAFWGDRGDGTYRWLYGDAQNFAEVSLSDLSTWAKNGLFSVDVIEDVLNLGLTYIVEIGDIGTFPAYAQGAFTVRITPHVAAEQTPPGYVTNINIPLSDYLVADTTTPTTTTSSSSGGGGVFATVDYLGVSAIISGFFAIVALLARRII